MLADVVLTEDSLVVAASDLQLDGRDGAANLPSGRRRALHHDDNDVLHVNFEGDYPGGVVVGKGGLTVDDVVKVGSDGVKLTGRPGVLHVEAPDLELDGGPERSGVASPAMRRALVHAKGDRLLLNCGHDYSGGVAMAGPIEVEREITAKSAVLHFKAQDLVLDGGPERSGVASPANRRALVHAEGDKLLLNCGRDYSGGIVLEGPVAATASLEAKEIHARSDLRVDGDLRVYLIGASRTPPAGATAGTTRPAAGDRSGPAPVGTAPGSAHTPGEPPVVTVAESVSLLAVVSELIAQVEALQRKVSELESRITP
jgi:hypothetical protein